MKRFTKLSLFLLCIPCLNYADAPKGNGVIIDSAATDYYNGMNSYIPSVKSDIHNYTQASSQIQYMFPDVGYIYYTQSDDVTSSKMSTATITIGGALPCGIAAPIPKTHSNTIAFFYSFCAMPALQRPIPDVSGYTFPTPDLGESVELKTLVTYYQDYSVVPMITYDSDWSTILHLLYASQNPNLTTALQTLGTDIANTALSAGAKGLLIDNEVSIHSSTDLTTEGIFFAAMASALDQRNGNLFLFDAPDTAKTLYSGTHKNVVLMVPLYDSENAADDNTPSGAPTSPNVYYDVNKYKGPSTDKNNEPSVSDSIASGLNNNMPIMFVLPASATATMWNSTQLYNITGGKAQACEQPDPNDPTGTAHMNVLSNFLCDDTGKCPKTATGGNIANVTAYLSTANCAAYPNTSTLPGESTPVMQQYFDTALQALTTLKATQNPNYIGATLYTWRVPYYADYTCASHYYSQNNPGPIHPCNQVLPSDISPAIWQDFATWAAGSQ